MFDSTLFHSRRDKLASRIDDNSFVVLFSGTAPHKSRDSQHHFHVNRNFYYLTGIDRQNMAIVLTKRSGQIDVTAFIEIVDPEQEKWTGTRLRPAEARNISGIETIKDIRDLNDTIGRQLVDAGLTTLYLDMEQSGWDQNPTHAHHFAADVQKRYPGLQIRNIYNEICRLRSIKDDYEVSAIREAIRITKAGIENMMAHARPNQKEYEAEAHFDFVLKSSGVKEHAFPSIIAGGPRATVLHYEENDQTVADGDLLLCDLGAAYSHYSADISRTFPINGKFTARQKEIYEIVLLAMDETIAALKPGMTYPEVNDVTKATFARELKRIGLIQTDEEVSKYYYHSVSHPLGLDTHDVGGREFDWPIEVGTVLTIEPGLYIAEEGIGIRIEDDVLVTANGPENLSSDILKTVNDIESFMARHQ
ncbi:aminopeptidase P family protein [Alicyclobacillus dauci]|uniref:Xaa-Pro aminopeptidase n=1 Tax=Alicyclobacillus dauci TaxID=1475485 RepID=A0ABY6Z3Y4_9BACL|nr:aminopeptidase P family protein [Alicyclobacillus dauci]WAH36911.1 aminopeptidase P family protein [Alicyclobacillus dauci]